MSARRGAWGAAALTMAAMAAPAGTQRAAPVALASLEPGLWQLRTLGQASEPQAICVADGNALVQLQHRGTPCARLVIAHDARGATVHYTCPSNGFGQTSVKVETPRLARIDTQGIRDNAPFAYRAEARRIGECAASSPR